MKSVLLPLFLVFAAAGCATCKTAPCAADAAENFTLHQFSRDTGTGGWEIQDDVVMGGVSKGRLVVNQAGNAVFTGTISLENDGGFSSFQRDFPSIDVSAYRTICLGIKGDGKRYQIRVESTPRARHGYAFDFATSGEWEVIEIPFDQMYAIRHGDRLDLPNYPGQTLAQLQILIGNDREESFQLEVDRIWLK